MKTLSKSYRGNTDKFVCWVELVQWNNHSLLYRAVVAVLSCLLFLPVICALNGSYWVSKYRWPRLRNILLNAYDRKDDF